MAIGTFNYNEYMNKLHEEAEVKFANSENQLTTTDGLLIPEENKKVFNWLKKEYQKAATEVKVEMKLGDTKFEPGYNTNLQAKDSEVKEFKPGLFGAIETSDSEKKVSKPAPLNTELNKTNKPFEKKEETTEKTTSTEKTNPAPVKKAEKKEETKKEEPKEIKKKTVSINLKNTENDQK